MKGKRLLIFAFVFAVVFSSCRKDRAIVLGEDEPLSLTPGVEWALVSEPYAAFRQEPDFESTVVSHARRGDILMVTGKQLAKDAGTSRTYTWYLFDEGWIESSSLIIYDNRLKAENSAKSYL